jgi:tRNA(Ile)-lysidine synthase
MDIIERVKSTVSKYSMLSAGDHVMVGLSGGPDSVCLLTILNELKNEFDVKLSAAYIDHGLRPDEIPAEIEFCRGLCESLNIPISIRHIEVKTYSEKEGINKQEAARELRYKALEEISYEINANKTALAHNADDQAETIIMRLLRGSGPSGLSGIPPVRKNIIRPLIETERIEIEKFLDRGKIRFMIDSSNLGTEYTRNKLRLIIMPSLKKINPDLIKTMSKTADIFRDEERYFDILVTKTLMKLISRKNDKTIELFLGPLEMMDTAVMRRVLRRAIDETKGLRGIGFIHIEDIANLVKSGKSGNRIYLPKEIRAIKGYATLVITSEKPSKLPTYVMEGTGDIILKEASMVVRSVILDINDIDSYGNGKKSAVIDADKIEFPLTIRPRVSGDFFYPIGLGNKKKLQDYFVDEKIPRDERDAVPLLTSGNNIVWVIGRRPDERYKVDKDTKRVLKLEIRPLKL